MDRRTFLGGMLATLGAGLAPGIAAAGPHGLPVGPYLDGPRWGTFTREIRFPGDGLITIHWDGWEDGPRMEFPDMLPGDPCARTETLRFEPHPVTCEVRPHILIIG